MVGAAKVGLLPARIGAGAKNSWLHNTIPPQEGGLTPAEALRLYGKGLLYIPLVLVLALAAFTAFYTVQP